MGSLYVLVMIAALSSHCSAYVVSHSETNRSTSSVILKEGQSAEISCMTKGTGDYFWRKGATLYNSTLVAYFTVGEVSDDSQPYSVTVNGTLHIRSVTLKDEGNYFCRVSSAENECYGEVKMLVQASLRNFDLAIDRCDGESSCLLYLDPSQFTSLTCTALNAPPLMTLKWFNGAKEITEGIEQNEILPQNGNSREVTSTVTAVYGHPASLTCQAVDPKRSNDDVRFVHAQVEMTGPLHESLAIWMSVAGTLAGCLIIYVIFSLIKARANRKKHKKKFNKEKEEKERLLGVENTLSQKEEENINLKGKLSKTEKELNEKKEEAHQFEELSEERNKKITELKTNLQSKEIALQGKSDDISKLKGNLTDKDIELGKIRKELNKLKTNLQSKDIALQGKSDDISKLKEELKKKNQLEDLYRKSRSAEKGSHK